MKNHLTLPLVLMLVLLAACGSAPDASAPIPAVDTGIDPDAWALVPAGQFLEGQHNHAVQIAYDYELMVTDVTNAQYAEYLMRALATGAVRITGETDSDLRVVGHYPGDEFRGHEHEQQIAAGEWLHVPLADPGLRLVVEGERVSAVAGYEAHPMVLVTWFGAKAYCESFGWRLPTETEWEKAARGTDGRAYPWGDEIRREHANYYSSHDIFEKVFDKQGDTTPVGFYNGRIYETGPAGAYQTLDAASPYGVYDMAGNVWQWTGDVYPEQHYRYMRGGSKDTYAYNLRAWTRNSAGPDFYSPALGFRCMREPQG